MSKLSRSQFKELLTEWNQSFINERINPGDSKSLEKLNPGKENKALNITLVSVESQDKGESEAEGLSKRFEVFNNIKAKASRFLNNLKGFKINGKEMSTTEVAVFEKSKRNMSILKAYFKNKNMLSDKSISTLDSTPDDDHVLFMSTAGNFFSSQRDDVSLNNEVDKIVYQFHDAWHVIEFNSITKEQNEDFSNADLEKELRSLADYVVINKYISNKLSPVDASYKRHTVGYNDTLASIFAFLQLYILKVTDDGLYSDTSSDIESSIDHLKSEIESFNEEESEFTNPDAFITFLKKYAKKSVNVWNTLINQPEKMIFVFYLS
jgi:hypothetical protein